MRTPPLATRLCLPAALVALALSGCKLAPEGACEADHDCRAGRHCAEGVCVPDGRSDLYAGCVVDRDCDPYAQCTLGACVLVPGRCAVPADCAAWESCEANVCAPLPGRCGTLEDCAAWEICVAAASTLPPLPEHRCALAPGRCLASTDCPAWQQCDVAARLCETAPGFCASSAECAPWEACGTTDHLCALRAGGCSVQDDCPPDRVCQAYTCVAQPAPPALDPAAVHLVGTLEPGTPGRAAIAPLGTPSSKVVGLEDGDVACGVRLGRDRSVVLSRGAATLATLVPDAVVWDAAMDRWVYPASPAANDVALALPSGCAGALSVSVVLQAGTDARLFACDGAWLDATNAPVGGARPLLAWSAGGTLLSGTADMLTAPVLLDAAGLEIPLSGDPMPAGDRLVAWRANGDGFRVVRALGAGFVDLEVWTIDAVGAVAAAAALPALPAQAVSVDAPLLDAAGAVFQLGSDAAGDGLVVKRTPGGAAEVVYAEGTLPAATSLLGAPVRVDGSCLLTGP
jgi:hypothetical protein